MRKFFSSKCNMFMIIGCAVNLTAGGFRRRYKILLLQILALFLSFSFQTVGQHPVSITINSSPVNTPQNENLYAAGSFNRWNPADSNFRFEKSQNNHYQLTLKLPGGQYEFKMTRGSWDKVECDQNGNPINNRVLKVNGDMRESLAVSGWQDHFKESVKKSSASKNVHLLDSNFFMPQLNRYRRIWIYLPEGYNPRKCKRYPVLYMHDGQNVFDEKTSFSGEWGVDEFMDTTSLRKSIVVAIDNGGDKRLNEYSAYDNAKVFGKGEGKNYSDFIVNTLRPFVNRHYKTKRRKKFTNIAGSSMGGLISTTAVLEYPKKFGGVGIFSPSFWITNDSIYTDIRQKAGAVNSKLYFYIGQHEHGQMASEMLKAVSEFSKVSKSEIKAVLKADGEHNEKSWRREFPDFYKFLLHKK